MLFRALICLFVSFSSFTVLGQSSATNIPPVDGQQQVPGYLAPIEVHTTEELQHLLQRAEQLFDGGNFDSRTDSPVAFVLHGPEAKALLRQSYTAYKPLVDLAARLSAFEVVNIRVCKTWLGGQGLDEGELPPFVETVPFGPEEERRLLEEESYVYF